MFHLKTTFQYSRRAYRDSKSWGLICNSLLRQLLGFDMYPAVEFFTRTAQLFSG